jgi:hypothetical protein
MPPSRLYRGFFCIALLLFFCGCGAVLVNEGSKAEPLTDGLKDPSQVKAKVVVSSDQKVVSDFEDGSTQMNPKLYGAVGGSFSAFSFGGNRVNNPFVLAGGANGTKMAAHLFGTLLNKGDNQYPAFSLQAKFTDKGTYDASAFQGIRFYYKCPADDQATGRRFIVPISATLPGSAGGTCSDGCYNHFGADLSPTGDWALKTIAFSDLKRQSGWGSMITPPDFVDHLKELVSLEWDHSSGNTAGSYNIDFWVDEVEFF